MSKTKRISKKNTEVKSVIESLQANSGEILEILQFDATFKNADGTTRSAKFDLNKGFRGANPKIVIEFISNLFNLLNINKRLFIKSLLELWIQNKFIVLSDLKSFIPKNKGGRKKKYLNRETGEILNMTKTNKNICELFNQGKEPEQIVAEVFKQFRSATGKMEQLKRVRRILKENKEFLTRPFN